MSTESKPAVAALKPYQERVIEEKRELDEKIGKLGAFMKTDGFFKLGHGDMYRLEKQANIMAEYSRILGERIRAFEP